MAKTKKIQRLVKEVELSAEQMELLCGVINFEGTGDHPWADSKTIGGFSRTYASACVVKAMTKVVGSDKQSDKELCSKLRNIRDLIW